jgi:signal transduction histidine kinase
MPIVPGDEPTGPVVTAPVQVNRMLIGMVVLPPPPRRGLLANVGEVLTLPGTLALIVISAIAAVVIFAPARNRLRALEVAAQQLGGGPLTARASTKGRDEIAADLEQRTDALRLSDRLRRQMLADISHELRTPLTTMRGYLDTLGMPDIVLDEEKRRRYLDTTRRETLRLETDRRRPARARPIRERSGIAERSRDRHRARVHQRRTPLRARCRRGEHQHPDPRRSLGRSDHR